MTAPIRAEPQGNTATNYWGGSWSKKKRAKKKKLGNSR